MVRRDPGRRTEGSERQQAGSPVIDPEGDDLQKLTSAREVDDPQEGGVAPRAAPAGQAAISAETRRAYGWIRIWSGQTRWPTLSRRAGFEQPGPD